MPTTVQEPHAKTAECSPGRRQQRPPLRSDHSGHMQRKQVATSPARMGV
jgi:hypothetical protein